MKKLTKENWIKTGLCFLAEYGEDAIRIDKLCKELKVSKGSFYHHFKNVDDFIEELMKFWEKENTIEVIEATEKETETDEKVKKLNALVIGKDHASEVRIRAWAIRQFKVNHYLQKIDQQRISYLKHLYKEKGVQNEKAEQLAKIEYAAFVGMQHLFSDLPEEEKIKLSKLLIKLFKHEMP